MIDLDAIEARWAAAAAWRPNYRSSAEGPRTETWTVEPDNGGFAVLLPSGPLDLGNRLARCTSRAVAETIAAAPTDIAALAAEVRALRAERDELAAELAAERGEAEGALPGWVPNGRLAWLHAESETYLFRPGSQAGYWRVRPYDEPYFDLPTTVRTPRAAMRAAESEARRLGLLPGNTEEAP